MGLREYGDFLVARIARIYPVNLATLVFLGLGLIIASSMHFTIKGNYPLNSLPFQLTMTQGWPFVPGGHASSWNYPSWSMSAEWFAYLAVYPICFLLIKINHGISINLFLILFLLGSYLILQQFKKIEEFIPLVQVSLEFIAGAASYMIFYQSGKILKLLHCYLDFLILFVIAGLFIGWNHAVIFLFPFIILGLTENKSYSSKILSSKFMVWMGAISYSLYMSHAIVLKIYNPLLPLGVGERSFACRIIVFITYSFSIILMACFFYYCVEIVARNRIRERLENIKNRQKIIIY